MFSTITLVVLFLIINNYVGQTLNENVNYAKGLHPSSIDSITYGQAIDSFCEDTEWIYFASEDVNSKAKSTCVQVKGTCMYNNKEQDVCIQFITNGKFVGLDGAEENSIEIIEDLMTTIFVKYSFK